MDFGQNWNIVLFGDKKKNNLDVSDGLQYYWHDLVTEKEIILSRNFGGS